MNTTDNQVRFIAIVFALLHVLAITGSLTGWIPTIYLYILNMTSGSLIVGYWLRKQIVITQHSFEMREMSYISFEVLVALLSGYAILEKSTNSVMISVQYSVAVAHLIALIIFLIFMLTVKFKRLF